MPQKATAVPAQRETRRLKDIVIGKRHREDMGDISGLAASIDELGGLLQPICIRTDNKLIAGQRRMAAWSLSKFRNDPIPVHVIDLDAIVRGEWTENAQRKDFTPSEAVAIKKEMEPLMKTAAKERQAHGGTAPGKKAAVKREAPVRAADQVAAFVGKDRRTIEKAEQIVDAAKQDPQKFGKLKEDMDRTGNVNGPFKRLQVMQQVAELKARPPALPGNGPYETVVFDYPWPQEPDSTQEEIEARGRSLRPYPPIAIKDGCHLMRERFAPLLAEKCTVYFFSTNFHMPYAYQLLAALGFTAPSTIGTWVKDKIGRGRILRDQTEQCIIMHRGGALIAHTDDTTAWSGPGWEVRENSQKPSAFYDLVERKSPAQRYLAVFSCGGLPPLWDEYGNEAGKYDAAAQKGIDAGLDDKDAPAALGLADLGAALERVAAGEIISRDAELTAAMAELVRGKRKLTLTKAGKAKLAEVREGTDLALLEALDAGETVSIEARAADRLWSVHFINSKSKPKITSAGKHRLQELREKKFERELLATLPDDFNGLLTQYCEALADRQRAVIGGEGTAIDLADLRLQIIDRAALRLPEAEKEDFSFDGLEKLSAAPLGEVPLWGQRGIFRLDIDGTGYLVQHSEYFDFDVYAESRERPFLKETGDQGFTEFDPVPGKTVAEHAEQLIRNAIKFEPSFSSKKKPRKTPMPLPAACYRMPASWDESTTPVKVGAEKSARKSRSKKKSSPAAAADAADRGGDDPAAENSIPAASDKSALIARAVKAGHTITMTLDHVNAGTSYEVATCQCGWSGRVRRGPNSASKIDEAIEAHWRAETAVAPAPSPGDEPDLLDIPGFLRRANAEAPA